MCWYIFYTPRGWAAFNCEKRTLSAMVLPTPSPQNTFSTIYKKQTGAKLRFVALNDNSHDLVNKVRNYFAGSIIQDWNIEIDFSIYSDFSRKVLQYVYTIPYGETQTYGEIAYKIGKPKAARAVGQVLKNNNIPLVIPCHRVVGKSSIGGFSANGGIDLKLQMLELEKQQLLLSNR